MEKNNNPFTESELKLLKSSYSQIARKHHMDSSYVAKIAKGDRATNTDISKLILQDLQTQLDFLTPKK